jgi:hypothetical protein
MGEARRKTLHLQGALLEAHDALHREDADAAHAALHRGIHGSDSSPLAERLTLTLTWDEEFRHLCDRHKMTAACVVVVPDGTTDNQGRVGVSIQLGGSAVLCRALGPAVRDLASALAS